MNFLTRNSLFLTTAITAASLPVAPAMAQDADETARSSSEIVVTALRREQGVLDVPLSIQAISGEQLSSTGINQMSDLQMTTPGFVPNNSSGYNQMFIRGIGNTIFVGADPSVATFVDDVPRVFGTLVNNFVDVERVEIIKGAPGALYGRNATGGAVNIITRQPNPEELSGKFKFSYGEKDTMRASAFANIPLGERAAMTLAAEWRKHDPYIRNITPDATVYTPAMFPANPALGGAAGIIGFNAGGNAILASSSEFAAFMNSGLVAKRGYVDEDFYAVSGKLMFQATDRFKITFAGDYSEKDDDSGNGLYNLSPNYYPAVAAGFFNSSAGTNTTAALLSPLSVPVTRKFTTAQRGEGYVRLKDYGVSATAVLELDSVDLTSITAYRENKSSFRTELGFTPFNFLAAEVDIDKSTFYQELRAVSNLDGPLSFLVGASYLQAKFDGGLLTDLLDPIPFLQNLGSGSGKYTVTNWSAYLEVGYDFTENLNLTVSGRYINDENDAISFNPIFNTQDPFLLKEEKFLPAATLKYNLAGGGNIYARWARGFKAGGIVPVVPVSIFDDPNTTAVETEGGVFKGEKIDTYEIGIRTPLFDRRVQFTAAVFYNDYKDVHISARADPTFAFSQLISIAVVNAGSARTYGAEATVNARVNDAVSVGATAGYLNAKYKTLAVVNNAVLADFDLSGHRMVNSPEWQFSLQANVDKPVSDGWRVVANATASYTDDIFWQQSGLEGVLPESTSPSYWLVNARLGLKTVDDQWEIALYAKNLFNAAYWTGGFSSGSYGNLLTWGDPRIAGVEVTASF